MPRCACAKCATTKEIPVTRPLTISVVREPERREVREFIDREYLKRFGTTPPESEVYFVARDKDGTILGTIALDFCDEEGVMPLGRIYAFDRATTPFPSEGRYGGQLGRWVALVPSVSGPLMHVTARYGLDHGKRYGWCEHTRAVHRVCEGLGIPFSPIADATLVLSNVDEHNRAFYAHSLKTKPMFVYMMSLRDMRAGLESHGHGGYKYIQ